MKVYKFYQGSTLADYQELVKNIYGLPDDRMFSLQDLLVNLQRFAMRALKGIRKNNNKKLIHNLLISFSWLMSISNRIHIQTEEIVWRRFPYLCSYCGSKPCLCKKIKPLKRMKLTSNKKVQPNSLEEFQEMFSLIYPQDSRTLFEAGVHLAEELGELSEAIYIFTGKHSDNQFREIEDELADFISCIFGVANSAKINIPKELEKIYTRNCHACHNAPCSCNFSYIAKYSS